MVAEIIISFAFELRLFQKYEEFIDIIGEQYNGWNSESKVSTLLKHNSNIQSILASNSKSSNLCFKIVLHIELSRHDISTLTHDPVIFAPKSTLTHAPA